MRSSRILALLGSLAAGALGASTTEVPAALAGAGIDQKIGAQIPLDLRFTDEDGRAVRLGQYFGQRPVILAPVYYECPMLCSLVVEGMVRSLKVIDFGGEDGTADYEVVVFSFAPGENAEQAQAKRLAALDRLGRPEADSTWHFLTGSPESIAALTDAIGFRYDWDEEIGQYIHAASLIVLTPDGQVSRYLYGIDYSARDMRLALVEASENRLGGVADQVLLYCFSYNPLAGKYTAVTMNILRLAALITVATLGSFIVLMLRRDRRRGTTTEAHA